jgi:ribose-phosphate pyrophosphokinase
MSVTGNVKIFSGNAHPALAKEICTQMSLRSRKASTERFSDGEFNFQIMENIRGSDVFIVQPTCPPTDQHLMELLIMMDTFVRASAERVTAVIPYFGYARSDKERSSACSDRSEARIESDREGRCRENSHDRSARCTDPGIF